MSALFNLQCNNVEQQVNFYCGLIVSLHCPNTHYSHWGGRGGGRVSPFSGLYRDALPERATFFRL